MTKVLYQSVRFAVRAQIFSLTGQEFKPFSSWFYNYTCQLIFAKYPYRAACACWLLKICLPQAQYKSPAASLWKTLIAWTGTQFHRCYNFQIWLDAEKQKSSSLGSSVNSWMSFCVCSVSFKVFTASAVSSFGCQARKKILLFAEVWGGRPFQRYWSHCCAWLFALP